MASTIILKGSPLQKEAEASVAIKPGMLIEADGSGGVKPHATADVATTPKFAIEADEWGESTVDEYAIGDTVVYAQGGGSLVEVNAILTTSQTITAGDLLCSTGNGTLKAVATTEVPIAEALESVTTTAATDFIKVAVL